MSVLSLRQRSLFCAPLLAVTPVLILPAAVQAEPVVQSQGVRDYNIPSGPLSSVLTQFAGQVGLLLSADARLTSGKHSSGLSGTYTVSQALTRLLSGSGLTYSLEDNRIIIQSREQDGTTLLDPVHVEAGLISEYRGADDANSVEVGYSDLQRRNPATIKEVFAGESSVSVGGAIPLSQKVYVNGIEEINLAVSVDGARQNNAVFHHTGTNIIDPALLKMARIDPGVAPADAGPAALGGAIVYETVDVADVLAPGQSMGGFVSASYDSNGDTLTGSTAVYGRADRFEALGFIKHANGDDYEDGDGKTVAGTGADLQSYLAKLGYSQGIHRVELSSEQVTDDADRPFRANIGSLIGRPDPAVRNYELTRRNHVLQYLTTDTSSLWNPEFTLGYGETEIKVPEPYGSIGRTNSLSARFENNVNLGAEDVITLGLDYYDDEAEYEDPATPAVSETARNTGLFLQARLNPLDPLRVSAGVRNDSQDFSGINGPSQNHHGVSSNISATYDVTDTLQFNAGYSDVWGGIKLAENYIMNPGWLYDDMEPVRAKNGIAGFSYELAGWVFDGSVFRSEFEDVRQPTYRGGPGLTTDFDTEGFSLGTEYRWLQGFARLSYTDSEIEVAGEPASTYTTQYLGAPLGQIINLEVMHDLPMAGVRVGGNAEFALKNDATEKAGGEPMPAYEVFNAYVEYRPQQIAGLTTRLEANNLLNENYADRATYGQDFVTVRPLAEQGRSFLVTAKVDF